MAETAESMYKQTHDPSGLVWVAHTGTDAVPNAVYAGKETNDRQVYVARAIVVRSNYKYLVVGKFVPGSGTAFPHDNGSPPATFQVLTNPKQVQTKWALDEGPSIHPNAVKCCQSFTGCLIQYIGRTKYEGNHVVGYLYPNHSTPADSYLYFNHSQVIHFSEQYEILLAKPKPACQCEMYCRLPLNCSQSCPKKK